MFHYYIFIRIISTGNKGLHPKYNYQGGIFFLYYPLVYYIE
jgi:hypothetical protein